MITEKAIEKRVDYENYAKNLDDQRLVELLRTRARNDIELPVTRVLLHRAADAVHRLRQRISELEYRERSRECVGGGGADFGFRYYHPLTGVWERPPAAQESVTRGVGAGCTKTEHAKASDIIPDHPGEECPHCGLDGRCTHVCGWQEDARPDAVQILRERAVDLNDSGDKELERDGDWAQRCRRAHHYYAIAEASRVVADALEKERKG